MENLFLNRYPYTDFHELNLSWIIEMLSQVEKTLNDFVSINALKYADPIQWNITSQYEKNTIVIDPVSGVAFISVQPVPSGVALTNTDYWTVVFDLGQFVVRASKNFSVHYESDTTTSATFASTAGDWLVWGDTLYIATVNITPGDTYVDNGNIQHLTMEEIIGHISNLTTTDKTSIVNAINELVTAIGNLNTKVGDLNDLTTSDQTSIVNAINSLVTVVGNLSSLSTSDTSSIVNAINELVTTIGNLDTKVGDLNDLTTSDQTSIVNAINEVHSNLASFITNKGYVNVKDFGAVGDGITDDTLAFNTALATGKNVYVPTVHGETYMLSNRIDFTVQDQCMFGDYLGVFSASDYGGLDFSSLDDICIKTVKHNSLHYINIRNDLSNINAVGVLSPLWEGIGSSEIEIDHCMFYGFAIAINTKGRHINIKDNMFMECDLCVQLDYSTTNTNPNSVQGTVLGDRGIKIINNKMHSQNDKMFIKVATGNLINALVSGNILDFGGRLIEVSASASMKYSEISNNIVTNSSKTALTFNDDNTFDYNIVSNNTILFLDTNTSGYLISEASREMKGNIIIGNTIGRCNTPVIRIGAMVDTIICNNNFVDINANRCIQMNINPSREITNCVISNNIFKALVTPEYFIRLDYSPTITKTVITGNSGNWPTDCIRPVYTDGGNNEIQSAYT